MKKEKLRVGNIWKFRKLYKQYFLKNFLKVVQKSNIDIVSIVDCKKEDKFNFFEKLKRNIKIFFILLFNLDRLKIFISRLLFEKIEYITKVYNFKVSYTDIHSVKFWNRIKFKFVINYHDRLLPYYKGLRATAWSIYYGEKVTGFTFHIVDEKVDCGNILIQDWITVDKNKSVAQISFLPARAYLIFKKLL